MSRPLHTDAVGALYHPERTRFDEATQYNYRAGAHEILCFYASPTEAEVAHFDGGLWHFALFVRDELLFLLFRFGGQPWCDAPYSWWRVHQLAPAEAAPPFDLPTPASRILLAAMLIDADTGVIRALRALSLSPSFSQALHNAIRHQMARPPAPGEYDHAVTRYTAMFSTEQMQRGALYRCEGGE